MHRNDGARTYNQIPYERVRMTVPEAATYLGISAEAVRARIHRGTLEHTKDEGTVYVLLVRHDNARTHHDAERRQHHDDARTHHDAVVSAEVVRRLEDHNADLKDQVENLQRELEVRNDELRRKDHLLAAALERIPAIEAPQDTPSEPRESPVTVSEEPGKDQDRTSDAEAQKGSWWQRLFR